MTNQNQSTGAENPPALLVNVLRQAERVAVLTGAGISAESGVPTFRDAQTGLWAQYEPEELATPHAFRRRPRLVWEWYAWRRKLVGQAAPNAGHYALVEIERRVPWFTLVTQNVDGLHQQAGSARVIELHGNIHRTKCFADGRIVDSWPAAAEMPPPCPHCGAHLRPDVVWFGESLPAEALETAVTAAEQCRLFLSIGTSALVQPAASLPLIARRSGATVVEINLEPTPLTPEVDVSWHGPAGELLPALLRATWPGLTTL
jgi:NAD-dependent deacetylase